MSDLLKYNLGNANSPKFKLFGYALVIVGVVFLALSYFDVDALGLGIVGLFFGGVVVTTYDGVMIDMSKRKIKGFTWFYGYKYGEWENLHNYSSVSVVISHRVWKVKHMGSKLSDVTPREFVVCLLGKSHQKKQDLNRFDSQDKAMEFAREVSDKLNLPIERHQTFQAN